MLNYNLWEVDYDYELSISTKSVTLNDEMAVMLHYFFIILYHGRAVLLEIGELLVFNLRTAVAHILSIS